jgi:hypothetical protein
MTDEPTAAELELSEHLALLQRYLSDEVSPLVFSEALTVLVTYQPELVATEVRSWVAGQYRAANPLPISDYLFHAVRKLHVVGELELVPPDLLHAYLFSLEQILLEQCPAEDRDSLADDFAHLEESQTVQASSLQLIYRTGAAEAPKAQPVRGEGPLRPEGGGGPPLPARLVQGLRRLDLLLERLSREPQPAHGHGAAISPEQEEVLSRFLAAAAVNASDDRELESSLERVRSLGIDTGTRRVLRLLGRSLPDWTPPPEAESAGAPPPRAVAAMRHVVALGKDPTETARRFSELVHAACDELNDGSLARAVTMLEAAARTAVEDAVEPVVVRTVRNSGWSLLDADRLRACAESADTHQLLRRVLDFFGDLAPERLLDELSQEQRRERRRLLLALLTVHGASARVAALAQLEAISAGTAWADWYVERNLLHILRRVPPSPDLPRDAEVDLLARLSSAGAPLAVVKEAIAVLGQHHHPRAEQTLIARVAELEDALLGTRPMPYEREELLGLLDRVVAILARSPSAAARRCVVDHLLKRKPALGDTLARGAELGNQDLSGEPELVSRLVRSLRDELPARVFGLTVGSRRRGAAASQLVIALAGTGANEVREALAEVVERFPGEPFAADAERVLSRSGAPPPPAPERATSSSLAGDLGVFGLPTLLQNLADSHLSGVLTLSRADGGEVASLQFARGFLGDVQAGTLSGTTALFALLERHPANRFAFLNAPAPPPEGAPRGLDVLPLLMEGMRRQDELLQAAALVPDHARLTPTDTTPSRKADEPDLELMRRVWLKAVGGATPEAIEAETAVDPYRVRRLFEHWVEEGALVVG